MMSDSTMMDCVYSLPTTATDREELPMVCDAENEVEDLGMRHQLPVTSTSLAQRSIASRYNSAKMEGALRVMNHAGRILWRAAMEAIPGTTGSYNLPLAVLSKLFQLSCGPKSKQKSQLKSFPFTSERSTVRMQDDNQVYAINQSCEEEGYGYAMEDIQYATSDRDSNVIEPQQNKRKAFFGISSLFPPVVSDSEEEEDDESFRARKRIRRAVEIESSVHYV